MGLNEIGAINNFHELIRVWQTISECFCPRSYASMDGSRVTRSVEEMTFSQILGNGGHLVLNWVLKEPQNNTDLI